MKPSLCFVGGNSLFSLVALQSLLEQQVNIQQIIFAGYAPATPPNSGLPVSPPNFIDDTPSIPSIAAQHGIPVCYVTARDTGFNNWKNLHHKPPPDFLFVACFPFRLPDALCQWPNKWAINLHPSLLPGYRGADPLFWQLRHGETNTGFSLHRLSNELDAGPILLQKNIPLPQGSTRSGLDTLFASQGSEALCSLLYTSPTAIEQNPLAANYQPPPQAKDHVISTDWPAEQAYNFICGTHSPASGYPIQLNGQQLHITNALGFEPLQSLGKNFLRIDNDMLIQCSPGVLRAKTV